MPFSVIHSPIQQLTIWAFFTHSLMYLFTNSFICSQLIFRPPSHSFAHSLARTYSNIHTFTYLFAKTYSCTYKLTPKFTHPLAHSHIQPLTQSLMHLFTCPRVYFEQIFSPNWTIFVKPITKFWSNLTNFKQIACCQGYNFAHFP